MRFGNLFLLAVSLIMLISPKLSPFYEWITIFPMGLGVVVYVLGELLLDSYKSKFDTKIDNQITYRGSYLKGGNVEETKWSDLQMGDVIYLTKGNIVPADIILLDSG